MNEVRKAFLETSIDEALRATYRVQLHRGFTFDDAIGILDRLAALGISHLYCSPISRAKEGSPHGYDVVDHSEISEEIGGREGFGRLCAALAERSMGLILDIVPNHMAIGDRANRWWWDVLRNGPYSPFAAYFDIDWEPAETRLRHAILVPVLDDHYGRVLEEGRLGLGIDQDEIVVAYEDRLMPISQASFDRARSEGESDEEAVARINLDPRALHELLEDQHYRLALWKTAGYELNYRRFFAISDLAALRVERPEVFAAVHELVLELVRNGAVQGLRVDHIDGLRDPRAYLDLLRRAAPGTHIVVEKILEPGETIPEDWPVEGTTGYQFLNRVGGLFVDPRAEEPFTRAYEDFTAAHMSIEDERRLAKLTLMDTELASDIERLTDLFVDVSEEHRRFRDFTRHELRETLRETIAGFSVYRTYVDPATARISSVDMARIGAAVASGRARRPDLDEEAFAFLGRILGLDVGGPAANALAMRFQQTTGPVMAKSTEDTLFYRYNRFIALNEVGGDPGRFGVSPEEFHLLNAAYAERWPATMLATSTHDTKRSEDVRARLYLLSEMPDRWADTVARWAKNNERHRSDGSPDPNAEYFFYQTLVGTWPLDVERAAEHMLKAAREAKDMTSWISPDEDYEAALLRFVRAVLADTSFIEELEEFIRPLVEPGRVNSLSQTLLRFTSPGVPDTYQGSEVWDRSLVDPDNRRPVDHEALAAVFERNIGRTPADWLDDSGSGAPKMMLIARALRLRRLVPDAFGPTGGYESLTSKGTRREHIVGFVRGGSVAVAVPRLVLGLDGDWGDTALTLPEGRWKDTITGLSFEGGDEPAARLFEGFPVALLERKG